MGTGKKGHNLETKPAVEVKRDYSINKCLFCTIFSVLDVEVVSFKSGQRKKKNKQKNKTKKRERKLFVKKKKI